jgi:hypothetical protein
LFYRYCLELVMFNYYFMCSDVLIFCFGYEQMEFFFLTLFCLVFMLSNFSWNKWRDALLKVVSFLLSSTAVFRLCYNNPVFNYGFYHGWVISWRW